MEGILCEREKSKRKQDNEIGVSYAAKKKTTIDFEHSTLGIMQSELDENEQLTQGTYDTILIYLISITHLLTQLTSEALSAAPTAQEPIDRLKMIGLTESERMRALKLVIERAIFPESFIHFKNEDLGLIVRSKISASGKINYSVRSSDIIIHQIHTHT